MSPVTRLIGSFDEYFPLPSARHPRPRYNIWALTFFSYFAPVFYVFVLENNIKGEGIIPIQRFVLPDEFFFFFFSIYLTCACWAINTEKSHAMRSRSIASIVMFLSRSNSRSLQSPTLKNGKFLFFI